MSNEKHNEHWISRLNKLEELPGEMPLNKAASWERLQQRQEVKAPRKRSFWYWMAAAGVLLLCVVPFVRKQQPDIVVVPSVVMEQPAPPQATLQTQDVEVKQAYVADKKQGVSQQKKKTDTMTATTLIVPVAVADQPTIINPVSNTDTASGQQVAVAETPRKMRVVHINDVGGDPGGGTRVSPEHKQFKIALSGPAGFASQVVDSKPSGTDRSPKN